MVVAFRCDGNTFRFPQHHQIRSSNTISGALPPSVVCRIGRQIADALEAIHSAGEELRHYFPRAHDDVNELTNDINIDA